MSRPYAVPASPLLPRIPPERAGHSIPPRVSAERRLLRTSWRIPWESASRQKPSEASGFMADEQRFRRLKYRRFMSSLESTSGVSALACISFFPSRKTSGPLPRLSRRNSRVRAQARTVWRLDLPQSPHTSPCGKRIRTRTGTRKSALGFWAVPENVRPPLCPPASSGFPSRGSGLSSPGEPPCR